MWKWLTDTTYTWGFLGRVLAKTMAVLAICNIAYLLVPPDAINSFSLYNSVFPGRVRFPREVSSTSQSLTALFNSHVISQVTDKPDSEYRVFILGDSAAWGFLIPPQKTLAAALDQRHAFTSDGRQITAYNLANLRPNALKDLAILDYAMQYEPDMVLWMVTHHTLFDHEFNRNELLQANQPQINALVERYDLHTHPSGTIANPQQSQPMWMHTLFPQAEALGNALNLQLLGFYYTLSGTDHDVNIAYSPLPNDFSANPTYINYQPGDINQDHYFDNVANAIVQRASPVPVIIINEPIQISTGENSDVHYNRQYPRWVYDNYRQIMFEFADANDWNYVDLWDAVPRHQFTNSPIHIAPEAVEPLTDQLLEIVIDYSTTEGET